MQDTVIVKQSGTSNEAWSRIGHSKMDTSRKIQGINFEYEQGCLMTLAVTSISPSPVGPAHRV